PLLIPVDLGARSYSIVVERGALATVGARLRALGVGTRVALFTDAGIARLYGKTVLDSLTAAGFTVTTVELPEGEVAKTLSVASDGWDACVAARPINRAWSSSTPRRSTACPRASTARVSRRS